MEVILLEALR